MKKLILFIAVAAALFFTAGKAAAQFSLTATAVFNLTNYMKGTNYIATTKTMSINNAFIYNLISNAVANASNGSNNLATTLPAKGYIAYFPEGSDGKYNGFFYVTDSKGSYYQLSGYDNNGVYYSFMRLIASDWLFGNLGSSNSVPALVTKTAVTITPLLSGDDDCDCCCDCCGPPLISAYLANIDEKTGAGKYSAIDTASLSITAPYWSEHNDLTSLRFFGTFQPKVSVRGWSLTTPSSFYLDSPSTATFTGYGYIHLIQGSFSWLGAISAASGAYDF